MSTARRESMTKNNRQIDAAIALEQIMGIRDDISQINDRFGKLETKLDNQYVMKLEYQALEHRVAELEANSRWLSRTFIGAVIASAIGFFFAFRASSNN